jgi:hypothetical protein
MAGARTDLVIGGLAGLLGAGVALEAVRLRVGSALEPQPGFFPLVGGLLLLGLAALLLGRALLSRPPSGPERRERLGAPAALVAALGVYVALLPWAGYPVMTGLLVVLTLRVQRTRWPAAVAVGVLLALVTYVLFLWLGVPLPPGRLVAG